MFVAVVFQELGISCVELELVLLRLMGPITHPSTGHVQAGVPLGDLLTTEGCN